MAQRATGLSLPRSRSIGTSSGKPIPRECKDGRVTSPRPRSQPSRWKYHRVPRRKKSDPRTHSPKGVLTGWARIRRLFWSWWPWAIGGLALAYTGHWGWAAGPGVLATVSFLIAPKADPPRYGLDNKFAI